MRRVANSLRQAYEVVLFYIMMMDGPKDEGNPWYAGKPLTALSELGETTQGIVVLHHATLAYPQWQLWNELVGIQDRKFGYHIGEQLHVQVTNANHPKSMKHIAWTCQYRNARVFNFQSGHDNLTWVDPNFRKALARGIAWCAGVL